MNNSFLGLLQMLPAIVALIAQWVGLLAMRDERNGAWWTMMVGTAMFSLGALGTTIYMVPMFSSISSSFGTIGVLVIAGMYTLGGLVFASGFAMHGLSRKVAWERERSSKS